MQRNEKSDFLTFIPAIWEQFAVQAAKETGLDVYPVSTRSPSARM